MPICHSWGEVVGEWGKKYHRSHSGFCEHECRWDWGVWTVRFLITTCIFFLPLPSIVFVIEYFDCSDLFLSFPIPSLVCCMYRMIYSLMYLSYCNIQQCSRILSFEHQLSMLYFITRWSRMDRSWLFSTRLSSWHSLGRVCGGCKWSTSTDGMLKQRYQFLL